MLESQEDFYTEEEPLPEEGSGRRGVLDLVGRLSPGQRLILSVFLFLDICVLCFGCLLLSGKIGLPF
jgi:hypothetical protein